MRLVSSVKEGEGIETMDRDDEGRVLQRDREDQNIDIRTNICYDIRTSIPRKETILKES